MTVSMFTTRLSSVITGCGGKETTCSRRSTSGRRRSTNGTSSASPGSSVRVVAAEALHDARHAPAGTIRTARASVYTTTNATTIRTIAPADIPLLLYLRTRAPRRPRSSSPRRARRARAPRPRRRCARVHTSPPIFTWPPSRVHPLEHHRALARPGRPCRCGSAAACAGGVWAIGRMSASEAIEPTMKTFELDLDAARRRRPRRP